MKRSSTATYRPSRKRWTSWAWRRVTDALRKARHSPFVLRPSPLSVDAGRWHFDNARNTGERALPELEVPPGTLLAKRYRVVEERGRGGMGVVLLAQDLERGENVALKLLLGSETDAEQLSLRFRREFRAIQRIAHPNVVRVHDY